jgi:hypothetical protein
MRSSLVSAAFMPVMLAVVLQSVPASADPIVYAQPPHAPVQSTRASQDQNTVGLLFQTFDSFTLAGDTGITAISWQGSYFNALVADSTFNPPANASGFTIAFYADNSGTPGALLASQTFSPFAANETFVGQQAFTATLGLGIYDYTASWGGLPFLASGGTTYWLSVYAHSPAASPTEAQWGWNGGTGGDGVSMQSAFFAAPVTVNFDRAFALQGVAQVPEPLTMMLLSAGFAATFARRRRGR